MLRDLVEYTGKVEFRQVPEETIEPVIQEAAARLVLAIVREEIHVTVRLKMDFSS